MTEAIIHFSAEFSEDRVDAVLSDLQHSWPAEVEAIIDSSWIDAKARLGSRLYDGPMMRLNSWRIEADRLKLELGRTSYRVFMGTNLMHSELADHYGADVLSNPLGLSAVLESADGFLLLGRRNEKVAFYPNRIHPFAGTAERTDVFGGIRQELREELGIEVGDVSDIRCIGLAEDRSIRQPELIFHVKSRRTRAEMEKRLNAAEHVEVVAIRCDAVEIEQAIARPEMTPIASASLGLWSYGATRRT